MDPNKDFSANSSFVKGMFEILVADVGEDRLGPNKDFPADLVLRDRKLPHLYASTRYARVTMSGFFKLQIESHC